MTRLQALEAVAEAARVWRRERVSGGVKEWGDAVDKICASLDALDALPPPQPPGETVEVRAAVSLWRRYNGTWGYEAHGYSDAPSMPRKAQQEAYTAIITARVPLPTIPTITATVEPTP